MKKHNRTILQSIKKDFVKGFRRLFWFSYTILKYQYLTVKFSIFNKKITNESKKFPISLDQPNNPLLQDHPIEFKD